MKKNIFTLTFLSLALLFAGCNDFLDTMPDDRAEIDVPEKVSKLLVAAYPTNSTILIAEMSSDNAYDNSARFTPYNQEQEDAYLWKDITTTGNDSPKSVWDAHYSAVAAANQALQAIKDLGNPKSLDPQRGEALIARAYAHFALSNLFCLAYNPETASIDMGIPYSESPETQVLVHYERGNMEELYEKIDNDIKEGLPLINDAIYSVPKYHFNQKAAYAFAARFYLYYQKFDLVIQYANQVLGSTPSNVLRDWRSFHSLASNYTLRGDAYINATEKANLLIMPTYSTTPYVFGPYDIGKRYGHTFDIIKTETIRAPGLWGTFSNLLGGGLWGSDEKIAFPKVNAYFEYTDKVAGIGFLHSVPVMFTTDETLLCRAEAYILKKDYANGVRDINSWISNRVISSREYTQQEIVDFYDNINYMPLTNVTFDDRTVKKHINPLGFSVEDGDQENLIQCVLHLRRVETVHDGLRWYDIKRYGIEIAHNRDGLDDDTLLKGDPRRAVQLPQDVIEAGLAANPR